jgi:hypothetical protein
LNLIIIEIKGTRITHHHHPRRPPPPHFFRNSPLLRIPFAAVSVKTQSNIMMEGSDQEDHSSMESTAANGEFEVCSVSAALLPNMMFQGCARRKCRWGPDLLWQSKQAEPVAEPNTQQTRRCCSCVVVG